MGPENSAAAELLGQGLEQLGIGLDEHARRRLLRYCEELQKWNRKINLIARNTSLPDIIEKHFLDSLTLLPVLSEMAPGPGPLLDVGSGAGFPGLVVKIARPARQVLLLEPRQRRSVFLRHIIRTLSLAGIEVSTARVEDDGPRPGDDNFAVITGRAVADVARFLKMVGPCAGPATIVACMQGPAGKRGWRQGSRVGNLRCLGWRETVLPFSGARRFILLFQTIR
ncbi:MAG: 16S rRNA (guanine(527)-N(7))-methyltransferase RsmG [Proteobacteria bacterium]|nr:16S rRNA (guanine(527)-N(7))-methyltransferase RsmG [Pseudomonadota bacterium]